MDNITPEEGEEEIRKISKMYLLVFFILMAVGIVLWVWLANKDTMHLLLRQPLEEEDSSFDEHTDSEFELHKKRQILSNPLDYISHNLSFVSSFEEIDLKAKNKLPLSLQKHMAKTKLSQKKTSLVAIHTLLSFSHALSDLQKTRSNNDRFLFIDLSLPKYSQKVVEKYFRSVKNTISALQKTSLSSLKVEIAAIHHLTVESGKCVIEETDYSKSSNKPKEYMVTLGDAYTLICFLDSFDIEASDDFFSFFYSVSVHTLFLTVENILVEGVENIKKVCKNFVYILRKVQCEILIMTSIQLDRIEHMGLRTKEYTQVINSLLISHARMDLQHLHRKHNLHTIEIYKTHSLFHLAIQEVRKEEEL
ncbi:hypothetical protein NEFER03_2011 [Nematocida sp. LUAm3]|nr:hypothetical protein NEFER03_2011 [Nematocida sp. LUAm3]KAI5174485.1 hypothetical protein NEFER02_0606 [Nematocida sp. LUAm2]KAI5179136.1 hypothetical protein NEFER01_1999 [Nematocida sp. LUAm1]